MISEKIKKRVKIVAVSFVILFCFVYAAVNIFEFIYEDRQTQGYANEQYVVGVYDDKVAVYAQGDSVPIEIYDVFVSTLPIKDQYELKKGIKVEGKNRLKALIEDYTS